MHATCLADLILRSTQCFLLNCPYRCVKLNPVCNVYPITCLEDSGGRRSIAVLLTQALKGVSGYRHALATLPPGKREVSVVQEAAEPGGRSERCSHMFVASGTLKRQVRVICTTTARWRYVPNVLPLPRHVLNRLVRQRR